MLQIFFFSNFGCSAPECSPSEVSRLQPPRVSLKKWGQSVEKGNSRLLATLALSYCHALPTAQLPPLYPLLALMDGQDVAVGLGMILSLSITFSLFQFVKNCFSLFHVWVVCHILSLAAQRGSSGHGSGSWGPVPKFSLRAAWAWHSKHALHCSSWLCSPIAFHLQVLDITTMVLILAYLSLVLPCKRDWARATEFWDIDTSW